MPDDNAIADEVLAELGAAAEELAQADAARQAALERIGAALTKGDGVVPIKRMADTAGVSRVTAYRLLGRDPAPYAAKRKG